ncbi:MAG: hypothetical protein JSW59_06875, partial [Phycisphaerales bacterium]
MVDVQTKSGNNPAWIKWCVVAWLAAILAVIVLVRFSNTPAATRAGNDDGCVDGPEDEFGFRPIQQRRDFSTPSSRLAGHTPSLEEIVRSESKNKKSPQIIINQVSRRTLTGLQGVHVTVDSD